MNEKMPRVCNPREFAEAGEGELVALPALPGKPPMTVKKRVLLAIAHAVVTNAYISIHGETGTGKSILLRTLSSLPEVWEALCRAVEAPFKPLKVFPIEMIMFETPAELYVRRAIRDGKTFDENSCLSNALLKAAGMADQCYVLVWFREMGRVHSASVQGGLLDLVPDGRVDLPNGEVLDARNVAFVADSNYNCEETAVHTLVEQDSALARRAVINIPFDYLLGEEEERITKYFVAEGYLPQVEEALIKKVVELGQAIRAQRSQGNLLSVAPPTLDGYFAFLRMAHALHYLPMQEVANMTLLGSANPADRDQLAGIFSEVFGIRRASRKDAVMGGELF